MGGFDGFGCGLTSAGGALAAEALAVGVLPLPLALASSLALTCSTVMPSSLANCCSAFSRSSSFVIDGGLEPPLEDAVDDMVEDAVEVLLGMLRFTVSSLLLLLFVLSLWFSSFEFDFLKNVLILS